MSGFTKNNSGFHGIFPNPAGVPNPTRKATEQSTSPFTFSRRYLDWNRKTFIYRKLPSSCSCYEKQNGTVKLFNYLPNCHH